MFIAELIIDNYSKLNETDLGIWQYISSNKEKVVDLSIDDLADATLVSRTTISRFVRKIGLNGYSEFKFRLRMECEKGEVHDLKNVYEDACKSMIQYIDEQSHKNYSKICECISNSKIKFVYGTGDIQIAVAKQLKRLFMQSSELFYDFGGSTFNNSMLDKLTQDDLLIVISLSGNNENALKIAQLARLKNAKVISITEFKENQLTRLSNASLYISSTPLNLMDNYPNYKLTMIYFVLIELLFIKFIEYKTMNTKE